MTSESPKKVTVFAYQVGFGDCLLVRFDYSNSKRHVLIDFGSFPKPEWAETDFMRRIAEYIRQRCDGKLDAVVATHRHADHINGFSTEGENPGAVIAECEPDVIIQPWTEDPDARPNATKPTAAFLEAMRVPDARALERGRAFIRTLEDMRSFVETTLNNMGDIGKGNVELTRKLAFYGGNDLGNTSAVMNLMEMGKKSGKLAKYVYYGCDSGLAQVLPGVEVQILGPPTLEQADTIRKQTRRDPGEFWHLLALAAKRREGSKVGSFPGMEGTVAEDAPPYARWLIQRLRSLRATELVEFVRSLDRVLNNTSVILLFKIEGKKLLFPGDSQIENWRYAMGQPGVLDMLSDVNLYKVGHHGSLNATPKTLWNGFVNLSDEQDLATRLLTVLSTKKDVHGEEEKNTEVPRRPLLQALQQYSRLTTTESLEQAPGAFEEIPVEI